jgi:hypothetical protein
MTPDERDRFLALFAATWPHPVLDEARVMLWHRDLEPMDGPTAMDALDVLRVEESYQPSLAKFVEQYRALRRAEELKRPALPEPSPANPEQWRRFLEQARSVLTKEYPHDHRGRTHVHCPTCGKDAA